MDQRPDFRQKTRRGGAVMPTEFEGVGIQVDQSPRTGERIIFYSKIWRKNASEEGT